VFLLWDDHPPLPIDVCSVQHQKFCHTSLPSDMYPMPHPLPAGDQDDAGVNGVDVQLLHPFVHDFVGIDLSNVSRSILDGQHEVVDLVKKPSEMI